MSKKLYALISGFIGLAVTAAELLLAFYQPTNYGAYMAAAGIVGKAADEVLLLFVNNK